MEENKELTIEEIIEKLQAVTDSLEEGDLSLEGSFKAYEEGMNLIRRASDIIDKVEKKIIVLQNGEGGQEE